MGASRQFLRRHRSKGLAFSLGAIAQAAAFSLLKSDPERVIAGFQRTWFSVPTAWQWIVEVLATVFVCFGLALVLLVLTRATAVQIEKTVLEIRRVRNALKTGNLRQ